MTRQELLSRISVDPDVCFGKPCIRDHRVWVSLVLDLLAEGRTVQQILGEHPGITEADVLACIAYGAEMSRGEGHEGDRAASFWEDPTTEELIKEQNVAPADDLDAIGELWPVDDDPEELLEYILSERRERRGVARGRTDSHE